MSQVKNPILVRIEKSRFNSIIASEQFCQSNRSGVGPTQRFVSMANSALNAPDTRNCCCESYPEFLTRADHKARMEKSLYAGDNETAIRAARRLGGADLAIAYSRVAHLFNSAAKVRSSSARRCVGSLNWSSQLA